MRYLVLAMLPLAALAGCIGSSSGLTAMGSAPHADAEARSWDSEAVLVSAFSFEATNLTDLPLKGDDLELLGNLTADASIDGRTNIWSFIYVSAKGWILVVDGPEGVNIAHEEPMPEEMAAHFPAEAFAAADAARDAWKVDSTDALVAVRGANATLDAALAAGQGVYVYYALDLFEDGHWELGGSAGNYSFRASVAMDTGNVTSLKVTSGPFEIPGEERPTGPVPEPIRESGSNAAGVDIWNFPGLYAPCEGPTADCVEIPFETEIFVMIEASLTWGVEANDYDVYILDEEGNVVLQGTNPAGFHEALVGELAPGMYTVQVVPWAVVQDTWTFEADFTAA